MIGNWWGRAGDRELKGGLVGRLVIGNWGLFIRGCL